jgi:hypothetical protein
LTTVHSRHRFVRNDQIESRSIEPPQTIRAVDRQLHIVTVNREDRGERVAHRCFVIDDEHSQRTRRPGCGRFDGAFGCHFLKRQRDDECPWQSWLFRFRKHAGHLQ